MVHLLGIRTAELHGALSSRPEVQDFSPEPFTDFYRHGLYHGMLGQMGRSLDALRVQLRTLPEEVRRCRDCWQARPHSRWAAAAARSAHFGGTHPDPWRLPARNTCLPETTRSSVLPRAGRAAIERTANYMFGPRPRGQHDSFVALWGHAVSLGHVPGLVQGRSRRRASAMGGALHEWVCGVSRRATWRLRVAWSFCWKRIRKNRFCCARTSSRRRCWRSIMSWNSARSGRPFRCTDLIAVAMVSKGQEAR